MTSLFELGPVYQKWEAQGLPCASSSSGMVFEVGDCFVYEVNIFSHKSETNIAWAAQKTSNCACFVIMINVKVFPTAFVRPVADCTHPILTFQELIICFKRQTKNGHKIRFSLLEGVISFGFHEFFTRLATSGLPNSSITS